MAELAQLNSSYPTIKEEYEPKEPQNGDYNASFQDNTNGIKTEPEEPQTNIDILIRNVVCSFSLRCHLNLKKIALSGWNVEYRREIGMVTMKLRNPFSTASIWSSGKVTCTGTQTEEQAKVASRKFARILQKLGFRVRFSNYRVVNVLGTCSLPFGIKLMPLAEENREISYEPEIHPGATYKIKDLKATLKIFSTGSITVTAPCVNNVQLAIEHIFPVVYPYRRDKDVPPPSRNKNAAKRGGGATISNRNSAKRKKIKVEDDYEDDFSDGYSDEDSEESGSDESFE